jgi:C4-dicarboxylate-specific signal transduction histidine kinase
LREGTSTRNIPIVLLTARADEATKLAALSAGASDFLTKPFSITELHLRLKNLVDAYQLQKALAEHGQRLEAALEQLKATETQLVQSEKLASLGRLSAGIVHGIINPINYVETALYTLRGKGKGWSGDRPADYEEVLDDVEDGIKRVKNIVLDLRAFAQPNTELFDRVSVGTTVSLALRFLSLEWKDKVRIETRIAEDHTVWANQNALLHVVLNLLHNALDALKRKTFADEHPTIWIEGGQENANYILTIRDNGEGIAAEHLGKIFDPFFTTKDVGEGMGLGLSICYRIIEQHRGRMSVRSEPGKFCEFTLELPRESPSNAGSGIRGSGLAEAAGLGNPAPRPISELKADR